MSHSIFEGSTAAVATPMNGYGNLDFDASGKFLEWMIREGTDAAVVNGTTGGSATLDDKGKMAVIRYVVGQVGGRTPVIVGTGSSCTERMVELPRKVQELGVDALLQVTPYYSKTSQERLVYHFTQMADHASIFILLYSMPSRTGVTIQPETCRVLSEHPSIRETKEANGNLSLIARIATPCGRGFDIYSGNDDQAVPVISLDGKGVMSVLTDAIPKETRKMYRLYLGRDMKGSRRMQFQFLEIMEALFWDTDPIPVETALGPAEVCGDDLRFSLTLIESEQRERLAEAMRQQRINLKKELHNQTNLL